MIQPGRCGAQPGHIPLAPALLHPREEFGPEITILLLQEAEQTLRTWWPGPVQRHGEQQPPPCTSTFRTQSCVPSTAAVLVQRCCARWCVPAEVLLSWTRFPGCFAGSTTPQQIIWQEGCSHSQARISLQPACNIPGKGAVLWAARMILSPLQGHELCLCFLCPFSLTQHPVSAGNKPTCPLVSSPELRVHLGNQYRMVFVLNMLQISRKEK